MENGPRRVAVWPEGKDGTRTGTGRTCSKGIVVDKDVRTDGAAAATQMTAFVQEAVKYQVYVKHEQLHSNDTELDPEEELWDMPPLQPTREA